MNRYERDELIRIALGMAQVPNLDIHDIPMGVVQPDAYAVQWLQDILDFWYHMVPYSAAVSKVTLSIPALTTAIPLPTDFILDVRDGYIVQATNLTTSKYRVKRIPLQKWINRDLYYSRSGFTPAVNQTPRFYMIQGSALQVTPQAGENKSAELWYYGLPAALHSGDTPLFPNDYVIIEYIRIRALEWCNRFEPGIAQKFCDKIVAGMRAGGLMHEPEDDEIPFDDLVYHKGAGTQGSFAWMGPQ